MKTESSETFIRSFQFTSLDDIIYTNVRLAKIGYVAKDTCTFYEVDSETTLHLFYEHPFTSLFLKKFEDFWFALSIEHEERLQRDVFIGKLGGGDLLNSGQVDMVPKVPLVMFLRRWLRSNIELRNTLDNSLRARPR